MIWLVVLLGLGMLKKIQYKWIVISSLLYTISAYETFHRKALLSQSEEYLYSRVKVKFQWLLNAVVCKSRGFWVQGKGTGYCQKACFLYPPSLWGGCKNVPSPRWYFVRGSRNCCYSPAPTFNPPPPRPASDSGSSCDKTCLSHKTAIKQRYLCVLSPCMDMFSYV